MIRLLRVSELLWLHGPRQLADVAYGPVMVTAAMVRGAASAIAFDATEEMLFTR